MLYLKEQKNPCEENHNSSYSLWKLLLKTIERCYGELNCVVTTVIPGKLNLVINYNNKERSGVEDRNQKAFTLLARTSLLAAIRLVALVKLTPYISRNGATENKEKKIDFFGKE